MASRRVLVIDNGTYSVKAGFAGDDLPRVTVPPVVGRPRPPKLRNKLTDRYVGETAQDLEETMKLATREPIRRGIVRGWDNMEAIWDHSFRELGVEPSQHRVLMTESPANTRLKRRRMTEILFESYQVSALYVASTSSLALYATGLSSGVVVDSGADITHTVPIYQGVSLRRHVNRLNLGGETLTEYMKSLLALRGYTFQGTDGLATVRDIKEQTCFVTEDFREEVRGAELSKTLELGFRLPTGKNIILWNERFRVPEANFQPDMIIHKKSGVPSLVHDTVQSSDLAVHDDLYRNVVLAGGNTMFPGFAERLKKNLVSLAPPNTEINVVAAADRVNLAWVGGSELAASDGFEGFWVTRQQYHEAGVRAVQEKVF